MYRIFVAIIFSGESSYPNGVPEVYVQWRLQRRFRIDGAYLSIKLGPRPAETMPIILNSTSHDSLSSPLGDRCASFLSSRVLCRS